MNDRRQRLEDALRKGPRPTPPEGLDRRIKDEIPAEIVSPSRSRARQAWLVAAALVLLIGGGWLASQLLMDQPSRPATVEIAEQQAPVSAEDASSQTVEAKRDALGAARATSEQIATKKSSGEPEAEESAPSQPAAPKFGVVVAENEDHLTDALADDVSEAPQSSSLDDREELRRESAVTTGRTSVNRQAAPDTPPSPVKVPSEIADFAPVLEEREKPEKVVDEPGMFRIDMAEPRAKESDSLQAPLSYDEIRSRIAAGELPDPDRIDVDAMISHFDYGDRPPWRRGAVSLFIEGGAAPFSPSRWRTIRIGLRARDADETVGSDATIRVQFDPETISSYRRVGNDRIARASIGPERTIELGTIREDASHSWLFEVKLRPDIDLDQVVAAAALSYIQDGRVREVERSLRVGHVSPTWRTTPSSLQVAILTGAWAELLSGAGHGNKLSEMLILAAELDIERSDVEGTAELVELIDDSVSILRRSGRR